MNIQKDSLSSRKRFKGIIADSEGAIYLFYAVFVPVIIGFIALAVDLSYAYGRKGGMQAAADAAAMAGAMEIAFQNAPILRATAHPAYTTIVTQAQNEGYGSLNYSGYTGSVNQSRSVSINPPTSNFYGVTASIQETHRFDFLAAASTLLGSKYSSTLIVVHARARAESPGDYCMLALNPDMRGAFEAGGGTTIGSTNSCALAVNSNNPCALTSSGTSAQINVPVNLVGGYCATGKPPPLSVSYSYPVPNPYLLTGADAAINKAGREAQTPGSVTTYATCLGKTCTLTAPSDQYVRLNNLFGAVGGGLPSATETISLSAGTYIFNEFNPGPRTVVSTGPVTIIVTGAPGITVNGSTGLDVQAPSSGMFSGIAIACIIGCATANIHGGPSLAGSIYAPAAHVIMAGNADTACMQLIASTISTSGTINLNDNCPQITTRAARYFVRLVE